MSDHEVSQYCKEKMRQYDEHLKESPVFRDKVTIIETSLGFLVKAVKSYQDSDFAIKTSLLGIIFAILCQIGGFIYLWGRLSQTVEITSNRVDVLESYHKVVK